MAEFKPSLVCIQDPNKQDEFRNILKGLGVADRDMPQIAAGNDGIVAVATHIDCDTVVTGIVGTAGLLPTVEAIKAGKDIALANKETLIAGGPVVIPLIKKHNVKMLPADSEHSAIFQVCLCLGLGLNRSLSLRCKGLFLYDVVVVLFRVECCVRLISLA